MPDDEHTNTQARTPTEKWRRLPPRIKPEEMVETVPQDPLPSAAEPAGDPETRWMLRYPGF